MKTICENKNGMSGLRHLNNSIGRRVDSQSVELTSTFETFVGNQGCQTFNIFGRMNQTTGIFHENDDSAATTERYFDGRELTAEQAVEASIG